MRTHLDLFSGIGGFSIAASRAGFTTIAFCEIDPYAQQILKEKFGAVMADTGRTGRSTGRIGSRKEASGKTQHHWLASGSATLHRDIFTLNGRDYAGVDLITGGFPCQPFSCAGKRRGKEDDRHLWPQMLRVVSEARPAWVLGENVAGIVNLELDTVLSDLENIGYACWPIVIPAVAVDARHRRDRVWILAADTRRNYGTQHAGAYQRAEVGGTGGANELESGDAVAYSKIKSSGAGLCEGEQEQNGSQPANGGDASNSDQPGLQGHGGLRECCW